ncbi:MAG TPA: nucleotidyltransferase family protein [Acidobacteriaceae bacterium]|nr:nucleotidyltransferase family protein [Acidobacteriaceae bacterium]
MSTAALILAAGASRRLGRPKQNVIIGGQSLLERAVHTAQQAGLRPVLAVVQEVRWTDILVSKGAVVLLNPHAHEGMSASIRVGIAWLQQRPEVTGVVALTCDQPALRAEHLRALCADPARVTASAYSGRNGVPAYFPRESFEALQQLRGDAGARLLLQNAPAVHDETLALDIDTEEDVLRAQALFRLEPR